MTSTVGAVVTTFWVCFFFKNSFIEKEEYTLFVHSYQYKLFPAHTLKKIQF